MYVFYIIDIFIPENIVYCSIKVNGNLLKVDLP
jgi:hypothetical protein